PPPSTIFRPAKKTTESSSTGPSPQQQRDAYLAHVRKSYVSVWKRPVRLQNRGPLQTRTEIVIQRDGRVQSAKIREKSGVRQMDRSVSEALKQINFLHPIPSSVSGKTLTVTLNFDL
ncbi:MAG: TonB family protein, partial [Verrucomicrobiota bacterium]